MIQEFPVLFPSTDFELIDFKQIYYLICGRRHQGHAVLKMVQLADRSKLGLEFGQRGGRVCLWKCIKLNGNIKKMFFICCCWHWCYQLPGEVRHPVSVSMGSSLGNVSASIQQSFLPSEVGPAKEGTPRCCGAASVAACWTSVVTGLHSSQEFVVYRKTRQFEMPVRPCSALF